MKPTGIARYFKRNFYKYINMDYSQGGEQKIILDYFNGRHGILLSIGENDGSWYSNSLALIKQGWFACLVEPSQKVFPKLVALHRDNQFVQCLNVAIGEDSGEVEFLDSGGKLIPGSKALLSTCKRSELKRWGDHEEFDETTCEMISFKTLMEKSQFKKFGFLTIDCEGWDLEVLKQIDLDAIGCECICIEHNSIPEVLSEMRSYISKFGMKEIFYNGENIICAR